MFVLNVCFFVILTKAFIKSDLSSVKKKSKKKYMTQMTFQDTNLRFVIKPSRIIKDA